MSVEALCRAVQEGNLAEVKNLIIKKKVNANENLNVELSSNFLSLSFFFFFFSFSLFLLLFVTDFCIVEHKSTWFGC